MRYIKKVFDKMEIALFNYKRKTFFLSFSVSFLLLIYLSENARFSIIPADSPLERAGDSVGVLVKR